MPQLRRSSAVRAWTLALLWCALALRVAIPNGYMLEAGRAGWPRLSVCPAAMPPTAMSMRMTMPMASGDAHRRHHGDSNATDHPCAFAAASAVVDLAVTPAAAPRPAVASAITPAGPYRAVRPRLGLAAPPPPKTGPPPLA